MDAPDENIVTRGIISADQSEALIAVAALDSMYPDPPARLRIRGLDPAAWYHVEPTFPGLTPSGIQAPEWWGTPSAATVSDGATWLRRPRPGGRGSEATHFRTWGSRRRGSTRIRSFFTACTASSAARTATPTSGRHNHLSPNRW